MSDAGLPAAAETVEKRGVTGFLTTLSFWFGTAGLISAMLADGLSVLGRHIGRPLIGSIEIVQASVLVATSAALMVATLNGAHAVVHILIENVPKSLRALLLRLADLMGAFFFAALAIGSIWIAIDLRASQEISDVLAIPIQPLRIFWCANAVLIVILFLRRMLAPPANSEAPHDA